MVHNRLIIIEKRLEQLSQDIEQAKIGDYVAFMNNHKKLLYTNFIGGLARGLGTAIGLTILAAILFYVLRQTVNLPLIGEHIAQLLKIIDNYR